MSKSLRAKKQELHLAEERNTASQTDHLYLYLYLALWKKLMIMFNLRNSTLSSLIFEEKEIHFLISRKAF